MTTNATNTTKNYIAHNNGIIYGIGDSPDSAAAAAEADTGTFYWPVNPATDALVELLNARGGDVRWMLVDGVACTEDEAA